MNLIPLSIPHLVLSSTYTLTGDPALHTLTPFGHMDITFKAMHLSEDKTPLFDIRVEGDTASWMLDRELPRSFRKTIVGFVGRIVLLHSGWPINGRYDLKVHFKHTTGDIKLTGRLTPYVFSNAGV